MEKIIESDVFSSFGNGETVAGYIRVLDTKNSVRHMPQVGTWFKKKTVNKL